MVLSGGDWTTGMHDFPLGQRLCFTFPGPLEVATLVEIKSVNESNTSCGVFLMEVRNQAGDLAPVAGSQPGAVAFNPTSGGQWVVAITKTVECLNPNNGNPLRLKVTATW